MRFVAVLLLLGFTAPPASGQRHFPSDSAIRALATSVLDVSGDVGAVVGVIEADGTRRIITIGTAPFDGNTLFEIGSITKVFTASCLPSWWHLRYSATP